jgi:hypothetical protein
MPSSNLLQQNTIRSFLKIKNENESPGVRLYYCPVNHESPTGERTPIPWRSRVLSPDDHESPTGERTPIPRHSPFLIRHSLIICEISVIRGRHSFLFEYKKRKRIPCFMNDHKATVRPWSKLVALWIKRFVTR